MPSTCAVPRCKSADIHRFQFPSDPELNLKWRIAIKKEITSRRHPQKKGLWKPTEHSRVCGAHFKDEDFRESLANMYSVTPTVRNKGKQPFSDIIIAGSLIFR